ncbi:PLP-dependent aminotransferase family protein [Kribbella sp. NPDC049227]|uniref:MocR-like pyridoxine biosynthesis transcription factor PdxR n=1 Tax=Kribbella sp. NPDC049227 TaxID=3364113 RepID=UPI003719C77F
MAAVPIHRQLYDVLRTAILSGKLAPGSRVASSRQLARQLHVARTTVMTAFDQLIADGYLEARHGAWTSVAHNLPADLTFERGRLRSYSADATPRITARAADLVARSATFTAFQDDVPYNFCRPFMPAVDVFPAKQWRRLVIEHWSRSTPDDLARVNPVGVPALRHELTGHLRTTRGIDCDPGQIIITTGSEQAVDVLARIMLEPGDRVAIEEPSNVTVRQLFRSHGAGLVPVRIDRDGLVVDDLVHAPGRPPVLVHVMPAHQYPTGVMLTLRRRLDLLQWARQYRALIVEDDHASEYSYEGATLESLQALDSAGVVAYVGTFTKMLNPSIQIGYLIVPPSLIAAARAAHRLATRQAETVQQHVLARFMHEGGLTRHLRRLQRVHRSRRDTLMQALHETFGDDVVIGPATSGLQLHVRWPGRSVTTEVMDEWQRVGVAVGAVRPLYQRAVAADCGVVMSFASLHEAQIVAGVAILGKALGA